MKLLSLAFAGLLMTAPAISATNLSDDLDANNMPGSMEERQEEIINSKDSVDMNTTPSTMEERKRQEQVESDFSQTDDAEKTYDAADEEIDE